MTSTDDLDDIYIEWYFKNPNILDTLSADDRNMMEKAFDKLFHPKTDGIDRIIEDAVNSINQ